MSVRTILDGGNLPARNCEVIKSKPKPAGGRPICNVVNGVFQLSSPPGFAGPAAQEEEMALLHRQCCGPDVHKETVVVPVP